MKTIFAIAASLILYTSCQPSADREGLKKEIFNTEKAFEKMAAEKGAAEAFAFFADPEGVINRSDSIIKGKEGIKGYYDKRGQTRASVTWTPDFIDVSDDGTLGYTYGRYVWKVPGDSGRVTEYTGIFHTVWKKQHNGTWRYVWD
ncbi:MAG: nuclear transport factor 2 family protein [Bacteroidales bacterium]|nr:nuclear transport factor 2 family protein [Bacteroidales bacterium]